MDFSSEIRRCNFHPAGCPHQIRNLKSCTSVNVNFVSRESVGECIRLSTEYRSLPHNHRYKEDKLQVKKMTLNAISQAVQFLDMISPNTSGNPVISPLVRADVHQNPSKPEEKHDHAFMKQEVEAMKTTLEKEGHLFEPGMRAYLQKCIQDFLNKIDCISGSSSSQ